MDPLTIRQFARLTGLTVRAVRHYGELGLLQPAYVDPDTGYRYYSRHQVSDAAAIRRLRFLELALGENTWPVPTTVPGSGRIEAATLPACTVLAYRHHGDYAELDRSYRALEAHVERRGLTKVGEPREIYWTDPNELPVDEWITEIQFPIERA